MSSFIRLGPGKSGGTLGISSEGKDLVQLTPNMQGVRLPAQEAFCLGGKNDGTLVSVIEANQTVIIRPPVQLRPRKYEVVMSVNPKLLSYGDVSYPSVIEPGQPEDILIRLKATKKLDLASLDYVFTFYQVY